MKKNVIDIIRHFQTHHALQEEHERKHSHASENGAVAPSSDENMDINRSRPNELTQDVEFPARMLSELSEPFAQGCLLP